MPITLIVNGEERATQAAPMTPLLDVLREEFFLTGAKAVCREGFCGACTVHADGIARMSCLMPVGLAQGCAITTVEAIAADGVLSPLQQALEDHDVVQCGMCFPGMVMSLTKFLEQNAHPSRDEMKTALAGNICRCTGYERIIDAVLALTNAPQAAE
ncbi:(2Fe-2S)-binding protein [Metarhizobium album]|uniref:(2Fe-2S)-binding protein n=1 Tax=Metarhizobium album TaxID=2182425 RepID=A0A2U2DLP2_9HYPH|nr:(2Fe-2S)-binding protein [Rhizobium album]PWE54190.1 (2Fe-2S)-binding protein [Rhizobium album]